MQHLRALTVTILLVAATATLHSGGSSEARPQDGAPASQTTAPPASRQFPIPARPAAPAIASADALPQRLSQQRIPSGAEREFDTDFSRALVDFSDIVSGGPPKDGIPAIDAPRFVAISEAASTIGGSEPVIVVAFGSEVKIYPLQILTWHEIVNDEVAGVPVAVTFCPLCNTAIVFDRRLGDRTLDFGTTGRLRFTNLIMYDRQTETWWQQGDGQGITGTLAGARLAMLPSAMVSFGEAAAHHPGARVLSRDTGYNRRYGTNPYTNYDTSATPFLYHGSSDVLGEHPFARVVVARIGAAEAFFSYEELRSVGPAQRELAGVPVVALWSRGTASALDSATIAAGRDVGAANVFRLDGPGDPQRLVSDGELIRDAATGSTWSAGGRALTGPMAGHQLTPIASAQHFWFSAALFAASADRSPASR